MKLAQPLSAIDAIRDDFASLDEWEDRYRYVIELGHALEPLSQEAHNDINKVRGCVSQVWLECEPRTTAAGERILHYRGDSDSHLVRGLISIAIALFSDRTPEQILATDARAAFRELGLEQHLTPQRSNGVRAMIERIRTDAAGQNSTLSSSRSRSASADAWANQRFLASGGRRDRPGVSLRRLRATRSSAFQSGETAT